MQFYIILDYRTSLDDIFSKDLAKMRRPVYKKKRLKDIKEKIVNKRN